MHLIAGDWIIQKQCIEKPSNYLFTFTLNYKKAFPYTVLSSPRGLECNCPTFYKNRKCKHTKWVYNMLYVIDTKPDSILHAQYTDHLNKLIQLYITEKYIKLKELTKIEKFKIRVASLDEITYENDKAIFGKYYSCYNGTALSIEILKP